jgi:hypothetical protein
MSAKLSKMLWIVGLVAVTTQSSHAQVGERQESDQRVKTVLDRLDLSYTIDAGGDYRMLNSLGNGRSQVVFVNSETCTYGNMEIREIWSVGCIQAEPFATSVMRALLVENRQKKLGAWEIANVGGKEALVFTIRIAADADDTSVRYAILAAQENADEKERVLTGGDDL